MHINVSLLKFINRNNKVNVYLHWFSFKYKHRNIRPSHNVGLVTFVQIYIQKNQSHDLCKSLLQIFVSIAKSNKETFSFISGGNFYFIIFKMDVNLQLTRNSYRIKIQVQGSTKRRNLRDLRVITVADPGFPWNKVPTAKVGEPTYYFAKLSPKTPNKQEWISVECQSPVCWWFGLHKIGRNIDIFPWPWCDLYLDGDLDLINDL